MSEQITLETEILTAWDLAALAFKVRGMQSKYFKMPKGDEKQKYFRLVKIWESRLDGEVFKGLRKLVTSEIYRLANMISMVRKAQDDYFENRTQSNLTESIQLEKSLDAQLLTILKGAQESQRNMELWNEKS